MTQAPAPETVRRLDHGFRWRGERDVSRLESFSDAVFAIVLALLFLRSVPPESFFELDAAMKSMLASIPAYAITCYLWFEHWLFSRRYNLRDGRTAFLNLLLLFLLLVYAYPLKFLFTTLFVRFFGPIGNLTESVITQGWQGMDTLLWLYSYYSGGYLLIFLVLVWLYRRALAEREMLQLNAFELYQTQASLVRFWFQIAVAAASIALAFAGRYVGYSAPGWIYCVLGPGMAILGVVQGRRSERLLRQVYQTSGGSSAAGSSGG
ncbi:MAG: DUF1211 domain-containing protein [Planctomycetes bacterium]|nr:DUF1211 domain-containing protein [Planctomycetota bacterium]